MKDEPEWLPSNSPIGVLNGLSDISPFPIAILNEQSKVATSSWHEVLPRTGNPYHSSFCNSITNGNASTNSNSITDGNAPTNSNSIIDGNAPTNSNSIIDGNMPANSNSITDGNAPTNGNVITNKNGSIDNRSLLSRFLDPCRRDSPYKIYACLLVFLLILSGFIHISIPGEHRGWESGIYPEKVKPKSGDDAVDVPAVHLLDTGAETSAYFTVAGASRNNPSQVTVFSYINGTVEVLENGTLYSVWEGEEVVEWDKVRTLTGSRVQLAFKDEHDLTLGLNIGLLSESVIRSENDTNISGGKINLSLEKGSMVMYTSGDSSLNITIQTPEAIINLEDIPILVRLDTGAGGTHLRVYKGEGTFLSGNETETVLAGESMSSVTGKTDMSFNLILISSDLSQRLFPRVLQGDSIWGWDFMHKPVNTNEQGFSLISGKEYLITIPRGDYSLSIQGGLSGSYSLEAMQHSREEVTIFHIIDMHYGTTSQDRIEVGEALILSGLENTERNYDFKIEYSMNGTGGNLEITEIPIKYPERHRFKPVDKGALGNPDQDSLEFSMDNDGDGKFDRSVNVKKGMSWEEIKNRLDEEEDATLLPIIASIVILVLLIAVVTYFTLEEQEKQKKEKKATRRKKPDNERDMDKKGNAQEMKNEKEKEKDVAGILEEKIGNPEVKVADRLIEIEEVVEGPKVAREIEEKERSGDKKGERKSKQK